jgi:iron complex outermembrane recepter protein
MGGQSRRQSEGIAAVVLGILRAASICTSAAILDVPRTLAGAPESTVLTADIPAEPLAQALEAFARQTGLQLVYVSEVVSEQKSHAVPAGLDAPGALARILEGTGLRFEYLTARSIRILAAVEVTPHTVVANASADDELQVVVVTATRREEKLQNVPITIQVLSGEQLSELNVSTFNDVMKYTANVTYSGNGPGTGNIFIRGLGSSGTGNQSQSTIAPFPSVALYLDEQSMQFPARNNDVYVVDLERIEVLEGPQGTLFGGGAQAGVIRYITNKPKLDAIKTDVNAGYGVTAGGAPNYIAHATLNLPLIADKFAVRAVGFFDRRGGYIANVPGTISFDFPSATSANVRLISPVVNNANLVGPNTNPLTYGGFRLSGLYQFMDGWDLLIQQSYQQTEEDGYFYAYPFDPNGTALKSNQITAFMPAYNKDRYESTAWTLNGKFGDLKAIYAGSYMRRHIDAQQDYSNYLRSTGGTYYDCIGAGAGYFNEYFSHQSAGKPRCYAPLGAWHDSVQNEHQSHEIRLSTPEQSRVRGVVGAYWEKFVINDEMDFNFLGIPQCSAANLAIALTGGADCLSAVGPLPGVHASNPGLRENMGNAFGEDVQRGYKQYAFFASVDFDIVPKRLTLTAGTRSYHYDEFEEGSVWQTATSTANNTTPPTELILNHPNGACTTQGLCGFPVSLSKSESGFRSRANLTWHITPAIMTYYTYSQGFRPGGFNRTGSQPGQAPAPVGVAYYCGGGGPHEFDPRCQSGGNLYDLNKTGGGTAQQIKPYSYASDNLINHELGLKSEFLNHRLRLNASAYLMHWNNVQASAQGFTSSVLLFTNVINGPSYTIKGLELQLMARVTDGLTLDGIGSWNSSKQSRVPCLRSAGVTPVTPNNPTPAGQCITVVAGQLFGLGVLSSSLPFSPPVIFNLRAHYDWYVSDYRPFAWVGVSHTAATSNEPKNFPDGNAPIMPGSSAQTVESAVLRYTIPACTTYDGALGVAKDRWKAQLTGSNLSNANTATNISSGQFIKATVPLRPRVLMFLLSYTF